MEWKDGLRELGGGYANMYIIVTKIVRRHVKIGIFYKERGRDHETN